MKNINYSCRACTFVIDDVGIRQCIFWKHIQFPDPVFIASRVYFRFTITRNVGQSDQLPCILTRSWHVALIRCFPSTFPLSTNSRRLAGSSSQRAQGLPLFRKAQYAAATAGWATCPPQSRQYRPSLSINVRAKRQYVRRKATNSTNSPWEERPGAPVYRRGKSAK